MLGLNLNLTQASPTLSKLYDRIRFRMQLCDFYELMSWDLKLDSRYPYIWHINVDYDHLFLNIQDFQQEKKTCQSPSRPQESYKQGTYFTPRKCFLSARVHMSMVGYPPPSYICLISREIHWKSNGEYIKIDGEYIETRGSLDLTLFNLAL